MSRERSVSSSSGFTDLYSTSFYYWIEMFISLSPLNFRMRIRDMCKCGIRRLRLLICVDGFFCLRGLKDVMMLSCFVLMFFWILNYSWFVCEFEFEIILLPQRTSTSELVLSQSWGWPAQSAQCIDHHFQVTVVIYLSTLTQDGVYWL